MMMKPRVTFEQQEAVISYILAKAQYQFSASLPQELSLVEGFYYICRESAHQGSDGIYGQDADDGWIDAFVLDTNYFECVENEIINSLDDGDASRSSQMVDTAVNQRWQKWIQEHIQMLKDLPCGIVPKSYLQYLAYATIITPQALDSLSIEDNYNLIARSQSASSAPEDDGINYQSSAPGLQRRDKDQNFDVDNVANRLKYVLETNKDYTASINASIDSDNNYQHYDQVTDRESVVSAYSARHAGRYDQMNRGQRLNMDAQTVFVPAKASILSGSHIDQSGAREYVLTGCFPVPDDYKYFFSNSYALGLFNSKSQNVGESRQQNTADIQRQSLLAAGIVETVNSEQTGDINSANNQPSQKPYTQDPIFIADGPQWLDESQSFFAVAINQFLVVQKSNAHQSSIHLPKFVSFKGNLPIDTYISYQIAVSVLSLQSNQQQAEHGPFMLHPLNSLHGSMLSKMSSSRHNQQQQQQYSAKEQFIICRRYSHFELLYDHLKAKYPMLFIPPLPSKRVQVTTFPRHLGTLIGKSNAEQGKIQLPQEDIQAYMKRLYALERWLERILSHPVLVNDPGVEAFLYSDVVQQLGLTENSLKILDQCGEAAPPRDNLVQVVDESPNFVCPTYLEMMKKLRGDPSDAAEFYLRVFHPAFNLGPDFDRSQSVYNSIRLNRQTMYPHPYSAQDNQSQSRISCTMSVTGRVIEDDITGDYATLKQQANFLTENQEKLQSIRLALNSYKNNIAVEKSREVKRLVQKLQELVLHEQKPSSDSTVPESCEGGRIWCHLPHCQNCKWLTESIADLGDCLSDVDASDRNVIHVYDRIIDWIGEWNDILQNEDQMMKKYLSIQKEGIQIGKEMERGIKSRFKQQREQRQNELNRQDKSETESVRIVGSDRYGTMSIPRSQHSSGSKSALYNPNIETGGTSADGQISTSPTPVHLQPVHVLSRLSTVYNVNHAEVNQWMHRQRQIEFFAMIKTLCKSEFQRAEQNYQLWRSCIDKIEFIEKNLTSGM
ncbi:hypothetical protein MP228_003668 [Amoeboaphelidium protococcarum]|nr:hypothetical protein MP228_003668 [Amoeboaphelidium protococcarum]